MLLAKSLTVPVELVQKPADVVTSERPFFQPEAGTSKMSVTQPTEDLTGASPVQATEDVAASMTATKPVEASGMMRGSAASMTATWPVEAPGTMRIATLPDEDPSARQEVHSQPTGSLDVSAVDQSLTSKRTVTAANTGVPVTEDELNNEPESPAVVSDQEVLSDRNPAKDDELDHKYSETNYIETMRGVRSFMGWHQIPDFDSSSSSLDDNSCLSAYQESIHQDTG